MRERPWGRVLARRGRGRLLRADRVHEGWVRLQEDFVEGAEAGRAGSSLGGKGDGGGWPASDLGSAVTRCGGAARPGSLLEHRHIKSLLRNSKSKSRELDAAKAAAVTAKNAVQEAAAKLLDTLPASLHGDLQRFKSLKISVQTSR